MPATLDKLRKKQKKGRVNVQGAILRQHLLLSIMYLIIFGVGALTLKGDETRFLMFVSAFSIFAVLQGVLSIFNVFYESNDIQAYMPLPFSNLEIFVAKLISCFIAIIYFIAPILLYCIFVQFNFNHPIYQSLLLGLLSCVIIVIAIMLTSAVLTYFLTKLPAFKKHKKVATAVMTALIMIGTILMLVMINAGGMYLNGNSVAGSMAYKIPLVLKANSAFWLFFGLAKEPFSLKVLEHLVGWLVVILVEAVICIKMVIPNIYSDAAGMQTLISSSKKKKLRTHGSSLSSSLFHYHMGFLSDTQVLISYLLMPPLIIAISIFPSLAILRRQIYEINLSYNYLLVSVLVGAVYALISTGMLSLIIISLDKENYNFIKSLPFDMNRYIRYKLYFSYFVQLVVPLTCMTGIAIFLNLPLFLVVSAILTYMILAFPICVSSIKKDHENLLLDWTNVLQLSQRGGSRAAMFGKFFGVLIIGIAMVVISAILAQRVELYVVMICVAVVYICILAYTAFCIVKAKKYFKSNL